VRPPRDASIQRADHVQREPLVRVLAHLFQHQIHHRGQAHAMLSGTAGSRRSSTSSSSPKRRRCGPESLPRSAFARPKFGAAR